MLATVQKLGAIAGLASGVGLVVLSALYVSHARDVKRLRDWAGGAPEGCGSGIAVPGRATEVPRNGLPSSGWGAARLAPILAGLLAAGGLVTYGVSQTTGGDEPRPSGKPRAGEDGSSAEPRRGVVKPRSVTVALLNGTTVDGLAAALRDQIAAAGFRRGTIDVFSDQRLAQSVVEYAPGRLAAAKAVGRTLGISRYQPVTARSRALAEHATVIVIAGADKAASAPAAP